MGIVLGRRMKDLNNFLLVVTISLILVTHDSGAAYGDIITIHMTHIHNKNYERFLDKAVIFNWGDVPSHIRPGIQLFHSVKEKISNTIQKKKELADITRDFMNYYKKELAADGLNHMDIEE